MVHYATEHESGACGCFLASRAATSVGEVEGVAERVEKAIDDTDELLAERFELEKAKGTLPSDFPSRARASLLFDMRQGYVFRGRADWSAEKLTHDLDDRVAMIIS